MSYSFKIKIKTKENNIINKKKCSVVWIMSFRQYNTELGTLVDKIVKVYVDKDKFFVGQLKGI